MQFRRMSRLPLLLQPTASVCRKQLLPEHPACLSHPNNSTAVGAGAVVLAETTCVKPQVIHESNSNDPCTSLTSTESLFAPLPTRSQSPREEDCTLDDGTIKSPCLQAVLQRQWICAVSRGLGRWLKGREPSCRTLRPTAAGLRLWPLLLGRLLLLLRCAAATAACRCTCACVAPRARRADALVQQNGVQATCSIPTHSRRNRVSAIRHAMVASNSQHHSAAAILHRFPHCLAPRRLIYTQMPHTHARACA